MVSWTRTVGVVTLTASLVVAGAGMALAQDTVEITDNPTAELCPADGSTVVIGYDTFSDTQEFAAARWAGLQDWADELGCIEWVKTVDNADGATALANVKTFINREVDGVLLLQVIADAQAGIIQELDEAGIPVMATDIVAPGAPFLSASDRGVGESAGMALAEAFGASGSTAEPWVLLGKVPAAGAEVGKRMEGAQEVLQTELGIPDDRVVAIEVNQQTADEAFSAALQVQGIIPDDVPVLVTGVNDEIVLGMYRALTQADRGRTLHVVGIGGLSAGLEATCSFDDWVGTVDYDPYGQTAYIVSMVLNQVAGNAIPDVFFTPADVVDAAGVAEKYPESCSAEG